MSKSSKSHPIKGFKIMGVSVEPTNATKGTVSYAGGAGTLPNPAAGTSRIQFSSDPKTRVKELDEFIATHVAKKQPQGRK